MAAVLAEVLKVDNVPVDSHFFDDLGADSMLMAQFCARLRKRPELPTVSIKDVYRHTTITALAAAFGGAATPAARRGRRRTASATPPEPAFPDPADRADVPQQAALLPLRAAADAVDPRLPAADDVRHGQRVRVGRRRARPCRTSTCGR